MFDFREIVPDVNHPGSSAVKMLLYGAAVGIIVGLVIRLLNV